MAKETQAGKKVQLQLVRSPIGATPKMRVIVRTLGLRKMNQKKVVVDNKAIRGMVNLVSHLVALTEV